MKYSCTIHIKQPLRKVVALWEDENNFSNWQDGFQSIELIAGKANSPGSKSRIKLQQGKRKIELIETIISNNLPTEKTALYEHIHMTNTQTSRFEKISEEETRYITEVVYTQFNGLMPKLMSRLFPGMFKKQSQKWMNQFKEFAEKELS